MTALTEKERRGRRSGEVRVSIWGINLSAGDPSGHPSTWKLTLISPNFDEWVSYTRRQINQDRMIFGDFSVNSEPIFFKFRKGHFLFKS